MVIIVIISIFFQYTFLSFPLSIMYLRLMNVFITYSSSCCAPLWNSTTFYPQSFLLLGPSPSLKPGTSNNVAMSMLSYRPCLEALWEFLWDICQEQMQSPKLGVVDYPHSLQGSMRTPKPTLPSQCSLYCSHGCREAVECTASSYNKSRQG